MGHQYRSSGGKAVVLVVLTFKNQLLPKFDEMYSDWLLLVNLMPSENSSNVHSFEAMVNSVITPGPVTLLAIKNILAPIWKVVYQVLQTLIGELT